MKKFLIWASILSSVLSPVRPAWADTPPPGAVKVKDSAGNVIDGSLDSGLHSINVHVTGNTASSGGTVNQGTANTNANAWPVTPQYLTITGVPVSALNADTIVATDVSPYRSMDLSYTVTGNAGTAQFQVQGSVDNVNYYPLICSVANGSFPYASSSSMTFIAGGVGIPNLIHCKTHTKFMRVRITFFSGSNGVLTGTAHLTSVDSYGIQGPQTTQALVDNVGQTINGSRSLAVSDSNGSVILVGQKAAASSWPVTLSNENVQDLSVTGAATQTAIVNNILTPASGAAATDITGYRSAAVQVVSTGTAGSFIFEGSNDNVNFQSIPVFNQSALSSTGISSAITATNSQFIYVFATTMRFVRLRIATTITGGNIQAFSKFSQTSFAPGVLNISQGLSANLQVTAMIATSAIVVDVPSGAITVTTTSGAVIPGFGSAYQVNVAVTAVSGTAPTMDIEVQESRDTGTNWVPIYDFPRITATGSYNSPIFPTSGNRIRYVQTIGGTTPSFTRAVNRLQQSLSPGPIRQGVDRTISLTTLSSTSAVVNPESQTKNLMLTINIGAATTPPTLQLQCSDDAGATFYSVGSALAAVANSTVSTTAPNITCQTARAIVTVAGTGVTPGYVLVRGF